MRSDQSTPPKSSITQIFKNLSIGEKVISIFVIFLWFVSLVSFVLSLSSFFMTEKNESVLNTSAVAFDYGNKASYDSCFTCIPPASDTDPYNLIIKNKFVLSDAQTQNAFLNNPVTFGNVYFPKVIYQNSLPTPWTEEWFDSKIRLYQNSDIHLSSNLPLTTNSINALQVGYFDYINNTTGICTNDVAKHSAIYYAIDPALDLHYMCICIMNPQLPVEGCREINIPSF